MEIRQIELFLRISEVGSINKAASEMRMSQPSLSRWLALLERDIGSQLFVRTRQGIKLTDAGQMLAERARPLLRQFEILKDDVGNKSRRQVNLGLPFSMQQLVTAPLAETVLREEPETSLRIYEGINNVVRMWMENGLLDAAILVETERVPDSFSSSALLQESLILIGPKDAGLQLNTPVPLSHLNGLPIILPGPPNVISAQVENALNREGFRYNNIFEAEMLSLCLNLTRRGLGYTVMPYCGLHERLAPGSGLSAAPIINLHAQWRLCINRSRAYANANRALVDRLVNQVNTLVEGGIWRFAKLL